MDKRLVLRRNLAPAQSKAQKRHSAREYFRKLGIDLAVPPRVPQPRQMEAAGPGYVYTYRFSDLPVGVDFTLFGATALRVKETDTGYRYSGDSHVYECTVSSVVCVDREVWEIMEFLEIPCLGQVQATGSHSSAR